MEETTTPTQDKWQDGPSTLHGGGCAFTFGDGHSEIHKWKDGRTLALKVTYTSHVPLWHCAGQQQRHPVD